MEVKTTTFYKSHCPNCGATACKLEAVTVCKLWPCDGQVEMVQDGFDVVEGIFHGDGFLRRFVSPNSVALCRQAASEAFRPTKSVNDNYILDGNDDLVTQNSNWLFKRWVEQYEALYDTKPVFDQLYQKYASTLTNVPASHEAGLNQAKEAVTLKKAASSVKPRKAVKKPHNGLRSEPYKDVMGWHLVEFQDFYDAICDASTVDILSMVGANIARLVSTTHPDWAVLVQAGKEQKETLLKKAVA